MCGRFALGLPHDEIEQMHGYNVQVGEWVGRDQFVPRYNVAPRTQAPVIRRRGSDLGEGSSGSSSDGSSSSSQPHPQPGPSSPPTEPQPARSVVESESTKSQAQAQAEDPTVDSGSPSPKPASPSKSPAPASQSTRRPDSPPPPPSSLPVVMQTMRWGLVPHFSKHDADTGALKTINARSEVLIEEARGMWASIKGRKRCAVVCQGYYEWMKKGKERLPHFTKRADGRLMLLAGLWDRVVLEGSTEALWTFSIVTTDASKEFSWLHDRQPVILPDEAALATWLDTSPGTWTAELSKLCAPYHASDHPLTCYAVPKEVGKIGTESPTFIEPLAERKDGIQAMFAKQTQKGTTPASPAKSSTRKLKRSASPATEMTDVTGGTQPAKKARVEKVNAWDADSDIEYLDDPPKRGRVDDSNDSKISSTPKRASQKPSRDAPNKTSPRKPKPSPQSTSSAKITSFFAKK